MKKRFVVAGGLLLVGSGCNLFPNPPVKCDPDRAAVVTLTQTVTPSRAGLPCLFVDPYPFTVAYSPKVDVERSKLEDATLVGGGVRVVQSSAATRLCPSVEDACANGGAPEIAVTVRGDGSISYQGLFSVDALGVVLQAGDTFEWEGVVATEIFAPGSSCPISGVVRLTCQKPQ